MVCNAMCVSRKSGLREGVCKATIVVAILAFTLLAGFASGLFYASPSQPLYNITRHSIPDGLQWYPVAVFGDNRPAFTHYVEYNSVFYQIIDDIRVLNPYAVIGTGDHVGEGRETQYEELYKTLNGLENVWLVPGNHDYHWPGSRSFWRDYVGPADYLASIPGWTFIMVDATTDNATRFNETLHLLFTRAAEEGGRLVVVEHYPIEPWVNHNLNQTDAGPQKQAALQLYIREYNVSLVLQGHWHGYAEKRINDTLYIITGGAGAPLYKQPASTDADKIITGLYHYMVFIFYRNGTYTYTTVYPQYGDLKIFRLNDSAILVYNTRYTLDRKPASLPFRFNLTLAGKTVTVLAIIDSGKPQLVKLASANPLTIEATPGVHSIEAVANGKPLEPITKTIPQDQAIAILDEIRTSAAEQNTHGRVEIKNQTIQSGLTKKTATTQTLGAQEEASTTQSSSRETPQQATGGTSENTTREQAETVTSVGNAASMLALAVVVVLIAVALIVKR